MSLHPSADPRHPLHQALSKAVRNAIAAELVARGIEPPAERTLDLPAAGRRCAAVRAIKVIVCKHIARAIPRHELDEHDAQQQRIDFGAGVIWTGDGKREILSEDLACAMESHLRGDIEGDHDAANECGQHKSMADGIETDDAFWLEKALAYHARHSKGLHAAGMCAQPEKPRGPILVMNDSGQVVASRWQEVSP